MITAKATFKRMKATAIMSRVNIVSADLAQVLLDLDSLNGETIGTTADDKITFAEGWRDDIKTAIEAYGISMVSAKPADYDSKVALIGPAVAVPIKTALDTANEEASATVDAAIDLVESNYAAIKAAITDKGVDMTGVKPSDYADKITESAAKCVSEAMFVFDPATKTIGSYGYNSHAGGRNAVIPASIGGVPVEYIGDDAFRATAGRPTLQGLSMPDTIKGIGGLICFFNPLLTLRLSRNPAFTTIPYISFHSNSLTELELPPNIVSVGSEAFVGGPIVKIIIGSGVALADGPSMGAYGSAFKSLYDGNGKLAGTYEYAAGSWSKTA